MYYKKGEKEGDNEPRIYGLHSILFPLTLVHNFRGIQIEYNRKRFEILLGRHWVCRRSILNE